MLAIDRRSDIPLFRQIYQIIRNQILKGELKPGERLPSTRGLAKDLGVSRIVTIEAYELLIAEGYLESQGGSGTFVARGAFLSTNAKTESKINSDTSIAPKCEKQDDIDFRSGIPALDHFPRKKWAEMSYRATLELPESLWGYDCPEGRLELREAVASSLQKNRGVQCGPDQVLIISGAVQGLRLIAQTMIEPGSPVIVEDPCNRDIRKIFKDHGAEITFVPVDDQGIETAAVASFPPSSVIITTPSHQFPTGTLMPVQRRIDLINWARSSGSLIIEDDYDSEYRYEGPPVSSLQGLDPDRVIYLGTFSKLLFPALRLGYMIAPSPLVAKFREIKRLSDIHSNSINQLTLARFIQEGHLERHIRQMKKIYLKRRKSLINSLFRYFRDRVRIGGQSTGLHLVAQFNDTIFTRETVQLARQNGIGIYPVDIHSMNPGRHADKLIFGYGHLAEDKIEEGIKRLYKVLK